MNWQQITKLEDIDTIKKVSHNQKALIFKHSKTCGICLRVLHELEKAWKQEEVGDLQLYFLDLLRYREVSNHIADTFEVVHQSPQILIVKQEKSVFDTSHWNITFEKIKENL